MSAFALNSTFPPVRKLAESTVEVWQASGTDFPSLDRRYSVKEQEQLAGRMELCIDSLKADANKAPRLRTNVDRALQHATSAVTKLAVCALDLDNAYVEGLFQNGFSHIGIDLARYARELDPSISTGDILQACRNAWTAGGLQLLLTESMQLTPAIFAYSMLYPYSDNYLDDHTVSPDAKLRFSSRFRLRLAGESLPPSTAHEEIIWELVSLIERQYSRTQFPQVYDSLLAIHDAQLNSLGQTQETSEMADHDILAISVMKGGTSVLADAYLAAAVLTDNECSFAFDWGVLLQLSDDLRDIWQDIEQGSKTLFSQAARSEPLDHLTNRAFHLVDYVMAQVTPLPYGSELIKDLLTKSARSVLMQGVANAPGMYTESYLQKLETYSPFRFGYVRTGGQQIAEHGTCHEMLVDLLLGTSRCRRVPGRHSYRDEPV